MQKVSQFFTDSDLGSITISGEIARVHPELPLSALQEIATTYNPELAEAPVRITHDGVPSSWAAFGWVKKLWLAGEKLMADMTLHNSLVNLIKEGMVKKRSVGIRKDFQGSGKPYLDHLAFEGCNLPKIKGMPDLAFIDCQKDCQKFTTDVEFMLAVQDSTQKLKKEVAEMATYTEEQLNDLINAAVQKAKAEWESQIADKQKTFAEEKAAMETQIKSFVSKIEANEKALKEFAEKTHLIEATAKVDKLIAEGKLMPAVKDDTIKNLCEARKFSEPLFNGMVKTLEASPVLIQFGEDSRAVGAGKGPQKYDRAIESGSMSLEEAEAFAAQKGGK